MSKTPAQIIADTKAASAQKAATTTTNVVTSMDAPNPQEQNTQELLAQLAAAQAALANKDEELAKVKAKLPVNDYITLRGGSPTFSVVIEGKRCLFVNFLFITRDRLLANKILAEYSNITEVKEDEQSIQHTMPEVSQVI